VTAAHYLAANTHDAARDGQSALLLALRADQWSHSRQPLVFDVLGMAFAGLETRPVLAAPLLETFAVMELVKTAPWSRTRPVLHHLTAGARLLVVLEDHRGDLIAFATDASATVQAEAFQGLRALRERVGDRLKAGLLLHPGEAFRSAGAGLWAVPFQALWASA